MDPEHDPDVQAALDECQKLILRFENMNLFPAELLKIETILSARLTFLLGKKAEYQFNQNAAYWIRKTEHSRESIKARKIKAASNQPMVDHLAITQIKDRIDEESYSVWRYEHIKGFCRGLETILVAIAHRLKDQFTERTTTTNQSW